MCYSHWNSIALSRWLLPPIVTDLAWYPGCSFPRNFTVSTFGPRRRRLVSSVIFFSNSGGLRRFALVPAAAAELAQKFSPPSAAAAADFSTKVGCSCGSAARLTPLVLSEMGKFSYPPWSFSSDEWSEFQSSLRIKSHMYDRKRSQIWLK